MASNRHLLVVASHCEAEGPLTNLHSIAYAFAETLRDDLRGHCGIEGRTGVLLDADRETTERAVARAAAFARDKVLVFVWIGHGRAHDQRFYLMPFDARAETIEDSGIELVSLLETIRKAEPGPGGVLLAIDACQAGTILVSSLKAWVQSQRPAVPIVILTATGEAAAYDLSFSRGLTELLRDGIGNAHKDLSCSILRDRLCEITCAQTAHLLHYDDAPGSTPMWMGHNIAFHRKSFSKLPDLREHEMVLSRVIESVAHRLKTGSASMAFVADAGAGKTILSAMLVQMPDSLRKITGRQHLVDASFFATEDTTFFRVVQALAAQLALYKGFRDASLPFQQKKDLPDQERMLLGPLRVWVPTLDAPTGAAKITLLLDSIDSIGVARPRVLALLGLLAEVPGVRVLLTGRSGVETPNSVERCDLGRLTDAEVRNYLSSTDLDPKLHDMLVDRIKGNWLCAAVFAEEIKAGTIRDPAKIAELTLERAFEDRLERLGIGGEDPENPAGPLTIVFMTLAAAGAGAVMPGSLLSAACAAQGGPQADEQLDHEFKKLGGLIAHGTTRETPMWGLFHQELVDYVRRSEKYRLRIEKARVAIVDVLQIRVPNRKNAEPVEWRYAFDREIDYRRELGKLAGELNRFVSIASSDPRDNRSLWARLNRILAETLTPDHRDVLAARNSLASWTGQCGDHRAARDLFAALLRDQLQVLDADDPEVLKTRSDLASWTGLCGDRQTARDLFAALLLDRERLLGAVHRDVFATRANLASWIGECGDRGAARALFAALLRDQQRVLDADDPNVLTTRNNLAHWTGECGDRPAARALFAALLRDQQRVLDADDLDVLRTRHNLAHWIGECNAAREACELFAALLPDRERVLGTDHPDVLTTRSSLAHWTGQCGNACAARDLFAALLPDRERVLGTDHLDVLKTRYNLASWTGECDGAKAARDLFVALLPDQERVLGANHRDVLTTRNNIASWTGECDGAKAARDLFAALLPDQERELGASDPDVLRTRNNLAFWTGEAGDIEAARDLFTALLPDLEREFGANHLHVLTARDNLAKWAGRAGDVQEQRNLFAAFLRGLFHGIRTLTRSR